MLASTQPPTTGADWAFEPKLDGWRALVYIDGAVTVRTRTGRDITEYVDNLQAGGRGCLPTVRRHSFTVARSALS
jgi:ATP-dependent DNA ligase